MRASLLADERDGCTAVISGCGVGGHVAKFVFLAPDAGPFEVSFDGDEVRYHRDGLHGSVLCTIVGDDSFCDRRATLEAYSPAPTPKKAGGRQSESSGAG